MIDSVIYSCSVERASQYACTNSDLHAGFATSKFFVLSLWLNGVAKIQYHFGFVVFHGSNWS